MKVSQIESPLGQGFLVEPLDGPGEEQHTVVVLRTRIATGASEVHVSWPAAMCISTEDARKCWQALGQALQFARTLEGDG